MFGFDDAAGSLLGGALGYFGQKEANRANKAQADRQMDFQEEMSNTAYQRAVKDMGSAGLNPMLAYQQGGASSPQGAKAEIGSELGAGVSSAAQTQSIANMRSQEDLNKSAAVREATQARVNTANANQTELQSAYQLAIIKDEARQMGYKTGADFLSLQDDYDRRQARARPWEQRDVRGKNWYEFENDAQQARLDATRSGAEESRASARLGRSQAVLHELGRNRAQNESDYHGNPYGGKYEPWLPDIGSLFSSGASAAAGAALGSRFGGVGLRRNWSADRLERLGPIEPTLRRDRTYPHVPSNRELKRNRSR